MFMRTPFVYFVVMAMGYMGMAASKCARTYTVQQGDTCDAISAANNASTYQIAHVNNGTINTGCSNLAIGEPICLGDIGQDCQTTYVVQSGDFCSAIATNAGIETTTLITNNPNVGEQCNLYPGEVLCTANYDVYGASNGATSE